MKKEIRIQTTTVVTCETRENIANTISDFIANLGENSLCMVKVDLCMNRDGETHYSVEFTTTNRGVEELFPASR